MKKERREYIKLDIAVDTTKSKQIISFRVTKGTVHDRKKFVPLIKEISNNNITKLYADKSYDSTNNFNLLDKLHIEPVIYIRKNASGRTENADQEVNKYT